MTISSYLEKKEERFLKECRLVLGSRVWSQACHSVVKHTPAGRGPGFNLHGVKQ